MKDSENGWTMNGFLVVDKPKGPSSHQIDFWIREMLPSGTKVGHVGTLDPMASGVLLMAIGKAVKLIDVAHEFPKEYIGTMLLHGDVDDAKLNDAFRLFTGDIYQLPPLKSAVARTVRIRTIYSLTVLERSGRIVLFHVKCQSGTYIRTLCTDIGTYLGMGSQLIDLRRIATANFTEKDMVTLQKVEVALLLYKEGIHDKFQKMLFPMDHLFQNTPKIVIKDSSISNISRGSDLFPGGIRAIIGRPMKGDRILAISEKNQVIATGRMLVPWNEISEIKVVDFDRVLIDPIPLRSSYEHGNSEVVRPGKERKKIPVQRHMGKPGGNHGKSQARKDTGNGGKPGFKTSGPETDSNRIRKKKNKGRI